MQSSVLAESVWRTLATQSFAVTDDVDWELSAAFRVQGSGVLHLHIVVDGQPAERIEQGLEWLDHVASGDDAQWLRLCGFYRLRAPRVLVQLRTTAAAGELALDAIHLNADALPRRPLRAGLSLLIRARNEEAHLPAVLASVADLVDEIVYVDNASTDQSVAIARAFAARWEHDPRRARMIIAEYPLPVPRVGDAQRAAVRQSTFGKNSTRSPDSYLGADVAPFGNTLGQYYNFVLRRASCANVMKWDADCVAQCAALEHMIAEHRLRTRRDAFALWCTGETLFSDPATERFWRKRTSYYDEYRVYSKHAGFRYRDNSCWEGPSWRYYDACTKERYESPVFYEIRPLSTVLARPIVDTRDQEDHTTCRALATYGNDERAEPLAVSPYTRAAGVAAPLGRLLYVTPHLGCGGVETMLGVHVRILARAFDIDVMPTRDEGDHACATLSDARIVPSHRVVDGDYSVVVWNAVYVPALAAVTSASHYIFVTHSDVAYFNAEAMRYVRAGDCVVTINEATQRKWTRAFDPALAAGTFCEADARRFAVLQQQVRVVHAPNALPLDSGGSALVRDLTGSERRLVFVGRLDAPKRLDVVLRAIQRVPDMYLDVMGDGPLRERLELLANDLRIGDRVCFCGRQSNSEVYAALHSGRYVALVLVSAHEGVPVVVLEAMRARVPVIAADVGGVGELVRDGETGFTFTMHGVQALARTKLAVQTYDEFDTLVTTHFETNTDQLVGAVQRLLQAPSDLLAEMRVRARCAVAERYARLKSALMAATATK